MINDSIKSIKILDYDINGESGNAEYYFHFFLGYLLPIIGVFSTGSKARKQ